MQQKNIRINSVQCYRGIACFMVLLHHTTDFFANYYPLYRYNWFNGLFMPGYIGVDFFFCLSGFIIYYTSRNKLTNIKMLFIFFKSRITRIYPSIWILTLFLILISNFAPDIRTGREHDVSNIFNSLLLFPSLQVPIISTTWSLSFEIMFYGLFGLFSYLSSKSQYYFKILMLIWCTLIVANNFVPGFMVNISNNKLSAFIFNKNNFEFLSGCFIGYLVGKARIDNKILSLIFICSISLLAVTWYLLFCNVILRDSSCSLFILDVIFCSVIFEKNYYYTHKINFKLPSWLIYMGDASFSIYIFHLPFLPFTANKIETYFSSFSNFYKVSYVVVFLLIGSLIFYHVVEKPINKFFHHS